MSRASHGDMPLYSKKYVLSVNREAFLQQDNVRPQTAQATNNKLQELKGAKLMSQLAYSLNLASSDYLFLAMVHFQHCFINERQWKLQ